MSCFVPGSRGRTINAAEAAVLRQLLADSNCGWLVDMLTSLPITETSFQHRSTDGTSHDIGWLSPADMMEESTSLYPGLSARPLGLICFGECLTGSGDPYFLDFMHSPTNPRVMQLYHDCHLKTRDDLGKAGRIVSSSLASFFREVGSRTY
jgi:hypothetical protein